VVNQTLQHDLERSALADCLLIFAARGRALREAREKLIADIGRAGTLSPSVAGDTPTKDGGAQKEDYTSAG
jgi:hypothetical protein